MKRKAGPQKAQHKWKRKLFVALLMGFCFGTLVLLMHTQYSRIMTLASLHTQLTQPPKVAFLFIARNRLPLDLLWDVFFQGGESRFSIYVHSRPGFLFNKATTRSVFFLNRQVNDSIQVDWGEASMIEAERILLKHALEDPLNQRFAFLASQCVLLYKQQHPQAKTKITALAICRNIRSRLNPFSNSNQDPRISRMVYSYAPTYYSTLHDSVTNLCKTILPFSFKKRRLPAAEHKLSKLQSDNLKWQQDSFHQMLNLMGLHKEGILAETEVSAFRSHLLDTLIASPTEREQSAILRDKLLFLQELLYAKCISEDEYHSSKRPLLQRLAVQGAEIEARDVIVAGLPPKDPKENTDQEQWSVIDLKDEKCLLNKDKDKSNSKNKSKHGSAMKQIKGAASVLGFVSPYKQGKSREERSIFDLPESSKVSSSSSSKHELGYHYKENEARSILMPESLPQEPVKESGSSDRTRRKPFKNLFQREQREGHGVGGGGGDHGHENEQTPSKSAKKQWGFDGFKKWKRSDSEDETTPLPLNERSDSEVHLKLVSSPMGEGPDTKLIKRKLLSDGSPSDFFIDKVLGEKIKKELSRIQTELCTSNPNLKFSNDQIEAISTKLPVDKADLKKFFPKSWCDRYGDVVLDVVKKEFKDHVGEMESLRNAAREKHGMNSARWTTFQDDEENCHPNLFASGDHSHHTSKFHETNPFCDDHTPSDGRKLRSKPAFTQENPFWIPGHGY